MQHKDCDCFKCKYGEKAYNKWVRREIAKYGFIVEFLMHDCDCPNHINYHTHGIKENFNHLDLQICFPLPEQISMGLFHNMVNAIKGGQKYEAGKKYNGIVSKYEVEFINAIEGGRPVLRLLVCDRSGNYPPGAFGNQLTMTGTIND